MIQTDTLRTDPSLPDPQGVGPGAQVWRVEATVVLALPLAAVDLGRTALPPEEQARGARLRHPHGQRTFLASRTLLRSWLSQVTGRPAPSLTLGRGPQGKPYLVEDPTLQFNLSHGGDWIALALSAHQVVGVDLEPLHPRHRLPQLCRRCLSDREAQSVLALNPHDAQDHFLRHWTGKEAYVKGLGMGLAFPIKTVDLTVPSGPLSRKPHPLHATQGLAPGWRLYQWQPTPGYVAALALHCPRD